MSDPGARPDLEWIAAASCDVDPRYQRTLESRRSQQLIADIAATWSWASCGCLLAMRAAGDRYMLIDGQHRVEAAKRAGIEWLPALVLAEMPIEAQARAFVAANRNRVSLTNFALHHARLVAGDAPAMAVAAAAKRAGITIPKYPIPADKMKPGETLAISTLYTLVARLGEEGAAAVLTAVAAPFREKVGMLRVAALRCAAQLYETCPSEAQRRELLKRISAWLGRQAGAVLQGHKDAVLEAMRRGTQHGLAPGARPGGGDGRIAAPVGRTGPLPPSAPRPGVRTVQLPGIDDGPGTRPRPGR